MNPAPTSLKPRSFRAAAMVGIAAILGVLLGSCGGPVVSYRYKLTLDIEVDGRMIQGFNVVEVKLGLSGGLQPGSALVAVRGEAIVLDIAPGKVLVALLMAGAIPRPEEKIIGQRARPGRWSTIPDFDAIYGLPQLEDPDFIPRHKRIAQLRGPRSVAFENLPDLVTFRDINDPKTVLAVDPRNLAASFRNGVSLKRATLEVVDPKTPLTTGIETKLPWIMQLNTKAGSKAISNIGTERVSTTGATLADVIHGLHFKDGK